MLNKYAWHCLPFDRLSYGHGRTLLADIIIEPWWARLVVDDMTTLSLGRQVSLSGHPAD
jgi:hypothetical protein